MNSKEIKNLSIPHWPELMGIILITAYVLGVLSEDSLLLILTITTYGFVAVASLLVLIGGIGLIALLVVFMADKIKRFISR